MAQKFLSDIHATAGVKDSSGDLGTSGQVLSSTGSLTNWVNPTVGTTVIYKDAFTATNGQTAFTLANTVDSEDKTQVYIDGAYQSKGGYTVSGTTLTFDTGLETSSAVEVITFSTATANNAASAVKLDTFTGDGSDLTFVLSEAVVDEKVTQVYINGVYQNKSTYSIAADLVTLTFGSGNAPPNSSAIEVISFKTITSTDGTLTATTFLGDLNGTINTATTATTQSAGNNSTKISTTAYTDAKVAEAITNGTTGIAPSQDVVFDALALKATLADPTFTGTVGGITKAMVGLSNVDNTTDALKPVSTAGQAALDLKANIAGPTFTGDTGAANLTLSGYLRGPASFVIDPAAHGDETGTLVVAGNLQVDGTTTTINSTTVSIDDLNFSIATDAADSAAANGAGITIGGAGASLTYSHSGTKFVLNKPLDVTGAILIQQSGSTGFTTEKTGGTGSFINLKDNAGSVFIGGVNSEFVVQTPGSSYSNKLTISSGGDATFSGNVTSGSSITLGASNGRVSATQGLFGTTFCLTSDGKATFGSTSSSVPIAFAIDGNGASPAVLIATNNDTTFSGKLSVSQSGADMIDLTRSSVGTYRLAISSSDAFSVFDVGANADRFAIRNNGEIAFGNGAQFNQFFNVKSGSTSQSLVNIATSDYSETLNVGVASSAGYVMMENAAALNIGTGGVTRLSISSQGVVAVGTTPITDLFGAGGSNPFETFQVGGKAVIGSYRSAAGAESMFANNIYVGSTHGTFQAVDATKNGSGVFCYSDRIDFKHAGTAANGSQSVNTRARVRQDGGITTFKKPLQIIGTGNNDEFILIPSGGVGTFTQLLVTIPAMNNASGSNGFGGYSCEIYIAGYSSRYAHIIFGGYINNTNYSSEVTVLRSSGSVTASSASFQVQGLKFTIGFPGTVHPVAKVIFNKSGNGSTYPVDSITATFS